MPNIVLNEGTMGVARATCSRNEGGSCRGEGKRVFRASEAKVKDTLHAVNWKPGSVFVCSYRSLDGCPTKKLAKKRSSGREHGGNSKAQDASAV